MLCCPISQCCLPSGVPVGVILWANQVGELFFLLYTRITKFAVLRIQLMPGEVLHNASSQRIPQNIGSCSKAVPEKSEKKTKCSFIVTAKGMKIISRNIFSETFSTFLVILIMDTSTLTGKWLPESLPWLTSLSSSFTFIPVLFHSQLLNTYKSKVLDLTQMKREVAVFIHGHCPFQRPCCRLRWRHHICFT